MLPVWMITAGSSVLGFFRKRPVAILYVVLIVAAAAFWWHYRDVLADNRQLALNQQTLELALEGQIAATEAVQQRSEEIAAALEDYQIVVAQLETTSRDLRRRNADLADRIENLDLEVRIVADPDGASGVASGLHNDFIRLRECRTNPDTDGTCSLRTDPAPDPSTSRPN